ncbi:MAG: glutamyl-tRNA reductase [Bacillota bacterium]
MYIFVVGANHRTAPLEVREKFSFTESTMGEALKTLRSFPAVEGCVILTTCNRTEIYAASRDPDEGLSAIWEYLSKRSGMDVFEVKNYTYSHALYDTIRHLFRVASGLDSMILGEPQILGQVRDAYECALTNGVTNSVINTLFQQALAVGKKVRTETGIDRNAVSVSSAAVELVKQRFGDLGSRSILIVGAGKMSELTVQCLVDGGASGVIVSNRSYEKAQRMASRFGGAAVRFDRLYEYMQRADIVISCTAASHYVVKLDDFAPMMEARKKDIFLIDIAVPRDIDPRIGDLPGVTLCDIDDLKNVIDANLAERKKAAVAAEAIVEAQLHEFVRWLGTQFVVPTISALRAKAEEITAVELKRAMDRLGKLSDREIKVICKLANSIANQLLHDPITRLKAYAVTPQGHLYTEVFQNLFGLEVEGQRSLQPTAGTVKMEAEK